MSSTLEKIKALASRDEVKISEHGYEELVDDDILARDAVEGVLAAELVEDYPEYPKGACVLVLQNDRGGNPIHVVWGIPKGHESPAVLVTAYRPDARQWDSTFKRRK